MLFAPPQVIDTEVFASLPERYRYKNRAMPWSAARRGGKPIDSFFEGPAFDRNGNLYVTDIPHGRVFRVSQTGTFDLVTEYDGEPNGLKIHKDGRIFITDYKNGIMQLDPTTGKVTPHFERRYTERFKGLNDLFFASNGDLYFTDQGRTGYQDASGKVYKLTPEGKLHCLLHTGINPNGLVLNADESVLYVGMTNANAVWHLGLTSGDDSIAVGNAIQLSGGIGPDGLALTAEGGLVITHPGMGAVWIFSRRGEPLYRVNSCGSDLVTNIAFGGPDRKTLYITDSGSGLILKAELPVAGSLMYAHQEHA